MTAEDSCSSNPSGTAPVPTVPAPPTGLVTGEKALDRRRANDPGVEKGELGFVPVPAALLPPTAELVALLAREGDCECGSCSEAAEPKSMAAAAAATCAACTACCTCCCTKGANRACVCWFKAGTPILKLLLPPVPVAESKLIDKLPDDDVRRGDEPADAPALMPPPPSAKAGT